MSLNTQVEIKFNNQPVNNDEIEFRYMVNGQPFTYTSGETRVKKRFVETDSQTRGRITRINTDGTLPQRVLGDFNGKVNVVKKIHNILVVGGNFTKYTYDNTQYDYESIAFLDLTGFPLYLRQGENKCKTLLPEGEVYDVNERSYTPIGSPSPIPVIDIVGDFNRIQGIVQDGSTEVEIDPKMNNYVCIERANGYIDDVYNDTVQNIGVFDRPILKCRSLGSSLLMVGEFSQWGGNSFDAPIVNLSAIGVINSFFNFNFKWTRNISGDFSITALEVNNGNIWIGGNGNDWDGSVASGIQKIFTNGTKDFDFSCQVLGEVYQLKVIQSQLYVSGNFTGLGGIFTNSFGRVNRFSGVASTSFRQLESITDIYDFEFIPQSITGAFAGRPNWVFVGDDGADKNVYINSFGIGGLTFLNNVPLNVSVRSVMVDDNNIIVGGEFTQYNSNVVLGGNNIEIGNNLQETIDNLLNNLQNENDLDSQFYVQIIDNNSILINYEFFNPNSLVDVVDIENTNEPNPRIEILVQNDSGNALDLVRPLLLRSDYIVKAFGGNSEEWNNTDYFIFEYEGNINNYTNINVPKTKLNKIRLNNSQNNSFLNISPLLETNYRDVKDYREETITTLYDSAKQGKFSFVRATDRINDVDAEDSVFVNLVLDGYRREREEQNGFENPLLLNGRYREVLDFYKLPFLSRDVDEIKINGSTYLNSFFLLSPSNSNTAIGYLNITKDIFQSNDNLFIEFIKDGEVKDNFNIKFITENCNYTPTYVHFVNSFGLLETVTMTGSRNINYDYDKETYKRPVRDVNGNFNVNEHTDSILNKNATKNYTINTGIMNEKMNLVLEDLQLSKMVWLEVDSEYIPCKLDSSNFDLKTRLRDRITEYTFNFTEDNKNNKNII